MQITKFKGIRLPAHLEEALSKQGDNELWADLEETIRYIRDIGYDVSGLQRPISVRDIDAAEAEVQKLQSRKETGAIFNYYLASMTQLLRELQLRRDGRDKSDQTVEFRMPHSKYWFTHPEGQYWPLRIMRYNEDVSGQMMNNLVRDMYLEIDALTRCLERHGITNWQEEIINY